MSAYNFFPKPKSVVYTGETVTFGAFDFIEDAELGEQGYIIAYTGTERVVRFGGTPGKRYAEQTLDALKRQGGESSVIITDAPDVERHGALLDISRDKIPTIDTLYHILSLLSRMRYNEVQLYIEGYSFEFEGYQDVFTGETPLTRGEISAFIKRANELGVDVIPNMNGLGHMGNWFKKGERFTKYAETLKPFILPWGEPTTIDPNNEEACQWIRDMVDDLLDAYKTSDTPYFNMNLDEPFELGLGKSKALCDKIGIDAVYADYVKRLNAHINAKGKQALMWGDMAFAREGGVDLLPKNVTLLDWNYEGAVSFEAHAKIAKDAGFRFYLCPGTSTWQTFLGRSGNAKQNVLNAAQTAVKHGAAGVMVTDWGDMGHLQYLPVSYIPFAFNAAYSWNTETDDDTVFDFLDDEVFITESGFARELYHLGDYYQTEGKPTPNRTNTFTALMVPLADEEQYRARAGMVTGYDGKRTAAYIEESAARLAAYTLGADDGGLIQREIANGTKMAAHGAKLFDAVMKGGGQNTAFAALKDDVALIADEHKRLWTARNKAGGLARSLKPFENVMRFYNNK